MCGKHSGSVQLYESWSSGDWSNGACAANKDRWSYLETGSTLGPEAAEEEADSSALPLGLFTALPWGSKAWKSGRATLHHHTGQCRYAGLFPQYHPEWPIYFNNQVCVGHLQGLICVIAAYQPTNGQSPPAQ